MCEDKILFTSLGYGHLFDNLNFLKELMTLLKSSRNATDYMQDFKVYSYIVDKTEISTGPAQVSNGHDIFQATQTNYQ
jgi:hypothetical protein